MVRIRRDQRVKGCRGIGKALALVWLPRPFGESVGVRGRWRWMCLLWIDVLRALHASAGRDSPRQGDLLSCTRKKVGKESAPTSATPALRFGANLRHSACGVRRRTHCALTRSVQTTAASQTTKRVHPAVHAPPRKPCAAGAASRGWQTHTGHRCARPGCPSLSGPSAAMARVDVHHPSGRAEKRRAWGGQGQRSMPMLRGLACCGCLSEENAVNAASSAAPPQARASQAARSEAQGHGQWGRLFFADFLLATQKKVGAPPGAYPGQRNPAETTAHRTTANNSNAAAPHPSPLPKGAREHDPGPGGPGARTFITPTPTGRACKSNQSLTSTSLPCTCRLFMRA